MPVIVLGLLMFYKNTFQTGLTSFEVLLTVSVQVKKSVMDIEVDGESVSG